MVGLTHYAWLGLVVSCDGRRGRSGDHRVMKCFVGFFVAERHQSICCDVSDVVKKEVLASRFQFHNLH